MTPNVRIRFTQAANCVERAVMELVRLRVSYEQSDIPERKARIRALDAKIDALRAVHLNPDAHPWIGDREEA